MGRNITLDIDDIIDKLQGLATDFPSMAAQAQGLGVVIPETLSKYVPMAGIGAQMLRKFMPRGDIELAAFKGLPDTGTPGKGRFQYLRGKERYSDRDVVCALDNVIEATKGTPVSVTIDNTVQFALKLSNGHAEKYTDEQIRSAVDQVLERDGLSPGMCDKFGDLINFCLNTITVNK